MSHPNNDNELHGNKRVLVYEPPLAPGHSNVLNGSNNLWEGKKKTRHTIRYLKENKKKEKRKKRKIKKNQQEQTKRQARPPIQNTSTNAKTKGSYVVEPSDQHKPHTVLVISPFCNHLLPWKGQQYYIHQRIQWHLSTQRQKRDDKTPQRQQQRQLCFHRCIDQRLSHYD